MERAVETHDPHLGVPCVVKFFPRSSSPVVLADLARDFVCLGDRVGEKDFGAGRRQGGRSGRKAETAVSLREVTINNAVTSMPVAGPVTTHESSSSERESWAVGHLCDAGVSVTQCVHRDPCANTRCPMPSCRDRVRVRTAVDEVIEALGTAVSMSHITNLAESRHSLGTTSHNDHDVDRHRHRNRHKYFRSLKHHNHDEFRS